MSKSYFIWNGKDCRSMGVTLEGPVPIVRGTERVQHVTIPGRAGELTVTEGDDIYQSYIQTVTIQVRGGFRVREIQNWLKGSGYVTFHGEPDRRQKARVIGAVTLEKHSRNIDTWVGECQFYCEPLKELLKESNVTASLNGSVRNNGDVASRPLMLVTCTGGDAVITIGDRSLTVTDNGQGTVLRIDCDAGLVTDTTMASNWNSWASGQFPRLAPGSNTIGGSGWSSAVITKRERYL